MWGIVDEEVGMNSQLRTRLLAFLRRVGREHQDCEDSWFSCPKHTDYIGTERRDRCLCWKEEAEALYNELEREH